MAKELRKISHRWSGKVLFEAECESQRECALLALKAGADLRDADLSRIDLSHARLDRARLDGASLVGASLVGASLVGARLDGANLDGASLDGARLVGASLDGARLDRASLDGARLDRASLVGARLDGANLDGASLVGASLDRATGLNRYRVLDLLMLLDQPGPIRLYKLVTPGMQSPIHTKTVRYEIGKRIDVADANTNEDEDCGAGINVGTLPWCLRHMTEAERDGKRGRILFMEFTAKDVACIPTGSDGKIRLHGATPVGEVDLDEILAHDAPVKMTEAR